MQVPGQGKGGKWDPATTGGDGTYGTYGTDGTYDWQEGLRYQTCVLTETARPIPAPA
jgi:hypothetical protein